MVVDGVEVAMVIRVMSAAVVAAVEGDSYGSGGGGHFVLQWRKFM